ncbi:MAG TPA: hypothetical protein VGK76_09370 [Candidatus Eisenbacteria bacterium]|jgi:hypothetical protein
MKDAPSALTLELLSWISSRPRTYAEAMEAWRSNCPRQPVWDDAVTEGLVAVARAGGVPGRAEVTLTTRGRALLDGRA